MWALVGFLCYKVILVRGHEQDKVQFLHFNHMKLTTWRKEIHFVRFLEQMSLL
jgi:hypothetical protein